MLRPKIIRIENGKQVFYNLDGAKDRFTTWEQTPIGMLTLFFIMLGLTIVRNLI